jgi:hypothetical protein
MDDVGVEPEVGAGCGLRCSPRDDRSISVYWFKLTRSRPALDDVNVAAQRGSGVGVAGVVRGSRVPVPVGAGGSRELNGPKEVVEAGL